MLVRGKRVRYIVSIFSINLILFQVTLGVRSNREVTITAPTSPKEIVDILFSSCLVDEPQAAVLQQVSSLFHLIT